MSKLHWYGLSRLPGVGGATLTKLLSRFDNAEGVFAATESELLEIPRVTQHTVTALRQLSMAALETELASFKADDIEILGWEDDLYPAQLLQISSPPPILYVRGKLKIQNKLAVAIVGTRSPHERSSRLAHAVARILASKGVTVVSGLAKGIDTSAHLGALEVAHGRTIAILGSGLNAIHPRENKALAARIVKRGAVLSELHPNVRARGRHLMARDRIISGLSRAVIIVEAGLNSGSLDTALKARKQNRLLYAVPGSSGTDSLIENGVSLLDPDHIDYEALIKAFQNQGTPDKEIKEPPRQLRLGF